MRDSISRRPEQSWLRASILSMLCAVTMGGPAWSVEVPQDLTLRPSDDAGWNLPFLEGIPHDALDAFCAPAQWDLYDWALAAGICGIGAGLYAEDGRIDGLFQRHRSSRTNAISSFMKPFGSTYIVIELGGVAIASAFTSDPRVTRTALLGTESIAFAMAGYEVLQTLSDRSRPSQGANRDTWGGPMLHPGGHSFPSGHATASFALASVVAEEWKETPGVAIAAYSVASLVGLSRLNDHAHWASDVFCGAVLGWATGRAVEWVHRSKDVTVSPVIDSHQRSIQLSWRF